MTREEKKKKENEKEKERELRIRTCIMYRVRVNQIGSLGGSGLSSSSVTHRRVYGG
jgi:hypothetical protein